MGQFEARRTGRRYRAAAPIAWLRWLYRSASGQILDALRRDRSAADAQVDSPCKGCRGQRPALTLHVDRLAGLRAAAKRQIDAGCHLGADQRPASGLAGRAGEGPQLLGCRRANPESLVDPDRDAGAGERTAVT